MEKEIITTIILAILASNGFFALLQFLITRHDTRKNVKDKLVLLEKDGLRTQLLLLLLALLCLLILRRPLHQHGRRWATLRRTASPWQPTRALRT